MIEKVNAFPMEELYYLESQDFLVDRESVYLKKNKTMKLNSYCLGSSKLLVNNDKLLFLFNGLRGYYDVRSRYIKEPKIFEKRVPFSKKLLINEYFVNKFRYSDMLIYSLSYLNRPTITIKKEEGDMHYWFPSRLVEYLNFKREILNAVENNKQFYNDIRQIKEIGFRYYLNPRRRRNKYSLRRAKALTSIALGFQENFLGSYNEFLHTRSKNLRKTRKLISRLYKKRRKCFRKSFQFFYKRRFMKRKKIFHKVCKSILLVFVTARRFLNNKSSRYKLKKKYINISKSSKLKKTVNKKILLKFIIKAKKNRSLISKRYLRLFIKRNVMGKRLKGGIRQASNKKTRGRKNKDNKLILKNKKLIKSKKYKKIKNEIFQKEFRSTIRNSNNLSRSGKFKL